MSGKCLLLHREVTSNRDSSSEILTSGKKEVDPFSLTMRAI
jgi:hypothetical protein